MSDMNEHYKQYKNHHIKQTVFLLLLVIADIP